MLLLHERWFLEDDRFPVQFEALLTRQALIPIAIAVAVTAAAMVLWRIRGGRDLVPGPLELGMDRERYDRLLSWMPLVLGVHVAVPLLVAGTNRWLFVPNIALGWHLVGGVLALGEIMVAMAFVYGALTRIAAALLGLIWLAGVVLVGPVQLLEQTIFLGIAFYLFANGRGPLAFDSVIKRLNRPIPRLIPSARLALRLTTGISLVVLAFTEKLANLPMAVEFLQRYPFNFLPAIGFSGATDADFALIAGTVELTFGMLLLSGAFLRVMILVLWVPFNLTLPFLGWTELVGHLPIYGVMALLLFEGKEIGIRK